MKISYRDEANEGKTQNQSQHGVKIVQSSSRLDNLKKKKIQLAFYKKAS
jgi:hypothetical protein